MKLSWKWKVGSCVGNSRKEERKEGFMLSRRNLQQPQTIFWSKQLVIKSAWDVQIIFAVTNSSHRYKMKILKIVTFLLGQWLKKKKKATNNQRLTLILKIWFHFEWGQKTNQTGCKRTVLKYLIIVHWNIPLKATHLFKG